MNGNLILVRGISGAGKSTVAHLFNDKRNIHGITVRLSTDDFFMEKCDADEHNYVEHYCNQCNNTGYYYNFQPNKLVEKHQECINSVEEAMKVTKETKFFCKQIVVHNTFTQDWEMEPYYDLADKYKWRVHTIIVENRHRSKSKHNVPNETIEEQRERFQVIL